LPEWVGAFANLGCDVPIKPLAMFCGVTAYRLHRSANVQSPVTEFIRTHLALLLSTDLFTVEVCDASRLGHVLCAVLLQLESGRVDIAGITTHPDGPWVPQIARNVTMDGWGILGDRRYLLHDRDKSIPQTSDRSSNQVTSKLRWVWSVEDERLSKIIPFGERSLWRAMKDYVAHCHTQRNYQGKNSVLLFHRSNENKRRQAGPVSRTAARPIAILSREVP